MGHHFVAVGTKGRRGVLSSTATATTTPATVTATAATAAAASTDAILGHGREEVGVLFCEEIELLALGFEFRG